ncbi:hypothetical protein MF271_19010 (plasmid) [Deinococcus sp. KNUC1210]|uniref:hypothetical protein n=1 Tax=Deinococcus sp. KNUC1210 TaxID=2917691 RepID=UPI001EF08B2E|nr:hypothetical protein [Deinococcus sp. KNUC1210]ULH17412.1 hypothetical protein MF271_19010 [Deinococcus sp. KNUC1210]
MANSIKTKTPAPEQVRTAEERGQMFRHLVEKSGIAITAMSKRANVTRSGLYQYFSGEVDLASVQQEAAQGILLALGLKDEDAWEVFNLPEEARPKWTTQRHAPVGHGEDLRDLVTLELHESLVGEMALPAGTVIQVDRNSHSHGILLIRLADGQLMAVRPSLAQSGNVEILGQLTGADFSTVLPAAVRAPNRQHN